MKRNSLCISLPAVVAISALCVLFGLTTGCSTSGKKETAEFKPGNEWIEDMRARVAENIEDPDKKTDMLALVDQIEKDLLGFDQVVRKLYAKVRTLSANYKSTPEEFRMAISDFEADRKEVRDRIIDSRFKMRDLSTPEEWKKLTDVSKSKGLYRQTFREPDQ